MSNESWVDEYLGFLPRTGVEDDGDTPDAEPTADTADGAYEDSWYQVLKARAAEAGQG